MTLVLPKLRAFVRRSLHYPSAKKGTVVQPNPEIKKQFIIKEEKVEKLEKSDFSLTRVRSSVRHFLSQYQQSHIVGQHTEIDFNFNHLVK